MCAAACGKSDTELVRAAQPPEDAQFNPGVVRVDSLLGPIMRGSSQDSQSSSSSSLASAAERGSGGIAYGFGKSAKMPAEADGYLDITDDDDSIQSASSPTRRLSDPRPAAPQRSPPNRLSNATLAANALLQEAQGQTAGTDSSSEDDLVTGFAAVPETLKAKRAAEEEQRLKKEEDEHRVRLQAAAEEEERLDNEAKEQARLDFENAEEDARLETEEQERLEAEEGARLESERGSYIGPA